MGWCHEFGAEIVEGCSHGMVAGEGGCTCQECGAVCRGRFPGCARVWARASQASAGGDATPAVTRTHVTPASWAAAASRPAAGFRHARNASPPPPDRRSDDPPADVETLKEQVRQLTLLTERLAGRLDAVLARPATPARQAPAPKPTAPPAPKPAPRRAQPAPPARSPARRPAPATANGTWPPDALDTLEARTEWKQLKRWLRGKPQPPS